jgi:hypothetical protein
MFRFITIINGLVVILILSILALAGIPQLINYQGMLTDNSGTPLTGSYNLTFKIWTDTTAGSSLWTETQNGVQVQDGLFNVILGRLTTLNLPFDQQYWLEVGVGAETMPRIRFTSVGYAYRSAIADSATVAISAPTSGGWTDDGKVVRLATSSDSVGIGTTTPQAKLHISGGDLRLDYGGIMNMIQANGYASIIWPTSNNLQVCNFATGYIDFRTGISLNAATSRLYIANDGNIGMGTINPTRKLHINGENPRVLIDASSGNPEINFQGAGDNAPQIWALYKETISGDLRFYQNGDKITIQNSSGNVGIGATSTGGYKLAVNGSAAKPGGGNWEVFSDIRLKEIKAPYEYGLSEISRLNPVYYDYKKDNALSLPSDRDFVGLVAQDVQGVIPDAVRKNDQGYLMLNNDPVIWAMLNAIKELKAENEHLRKRVEALESK